MISQWSAEVRSWTAHCIKPSRAQESVRQFFDMLEVIRWIHESFRQNLEVRCGRKPGRKGQRGLNGSFSLLTLSYKSNVRRLRPNRVIPLPAEICLDGDMFLRIKWPVWITYSFVDLATRARARRNVSPCQRSTCFSTLARVKTWDHKRRWSSHRFQTLAVLCGISIVFSSRMESTLTSYPTDKRE
jgi:hypothetical protein